MESFSLFFIISYNSVFNKLISFFLFDKTKTKKKQRITNPNLNKYDKMNRLHVLFDFLI